MRKIRGRNRSSRGGSGRGVCRTLAGSWVRVSRICEWFLDSGDDEAVRIILAAERGTGTGHKDNGRSFCGL